MTCTDGTLRDGGARVRSQPSRQRETPARRSRPAFCRPRRAGALGNRRSYQEDWLSARRKVDHVHLYGSPAALLGFERLGRHSRVLSGAVAYQTLVTRRLTVTNSVTHTGGCSYCSQNDLNDTITKAQSALTFNEDICQATPGKRRHRTN